MADKSLDDISEAMRDIDFCMLSTRTDGGAIAARPMSNNREVDYAGDSYFFTCDDARTVSDIESNPKVGLSYQGKGSILGKPGIFIAIEAKADLIKDKHEFEKHWTDGLDRWFEQGVDTPGLTLIHAKAERIHYWDGGEEGEVKI
ncbi:pyridoxamine 5'-phosphate oxidase family protein [Sphingomonas sabuli]|uniref:Pyridoxamine 5'-phosphate oxidase family protein n=1 Tax=Sphingomonas sabuli TaxID=2764186 RepID=A0A7G9L0I2_9SPHN|nr:pyridoxamine 5'-phosphate oxidase family protein [Sphingomonas sabuli]QNM82131.1 pyridoxamine 5'-phosphate oxidase family protein [Sphingomonas sabuli]